MSRKAWITVLTLATALIHLVLLNFVMLRAFGRFDLLFTLNGLGYLVLLAAYLLTLPGALGDLQRRYHNLIRWAFIAFTIVTILAWLALGLTRMRFGQTSEGLQSFRKAEEFSPRSEAVQ